MQDLLEQYKQTRKDIRKAWEMAVEDDRSILSGIIFDLTWVIEHLQEPQSKQNTRKGRPRRSYPAGLNPYVIKGAKAVWSELRERGVEVKPAERSAVEGLLQHLKPKERDVYLLIVANGFSQRETADFMRLSRRRVRDLYITAEAKVMLMAEQYEQRYAHPLAI